MMQVVIEISEHYYEILKYDVERGNDYKPIVLIANGTPLPKGHGRLIDADALGEKLNRYTEAPYQYALTVFNDALTIIEADKESKE